MHVRIGAAMEYMPVIIVDRHLGTIQTGEQTTKPVHRVKKADYQGFWTLRRRKTSS